MTVFTVDVPPGGGVPPHRHLKEEESYYMLNGSMLIQLGNDQWVIEPGDFVHVPAQMIHGYQNTSDQPVQFLAWTLGGAIDAFFIELSEKVQSLPEDLPLMSEILDRYGV
jgi:quercetin dioxygenase-like cupin family protein